MKELITTTRKMTSLEIAEVLEKQHKHVLRDIKKLIMEEAITEPNFGLSEYQDDTGRTLPMYELDFAATMILITGYDSRRRAMVIDRWVKLETGQALPMAMPGKPVFDRRLDRAAEELLKARPLWAKIKRYTVMGLTRKEICLLCGRDKSTIRQNVRRMEGCGILTPSPDLPRLQAAARRALSLS